MKRNSLDSCFAIGWFSRKSWNSSKQKLLISIASKYLINASITCICCLYFATSIKNIYLYKFCIYITIRILFMSCISSSVYKAL